MQKMIQGAIDYAGSGNDCYLTFGQKAFNLFSGSTARFGDFVHRSNRNLFFSESLHKRQKTAHHTDRVTFSDGQLFKDVTLFSSKGLAKENFESYLKTRFCPPFDEFPERDEYFRRARENELLMLSIVDPNVGKMVRRNIIQRNYIACMMSDIVFIPFAVKGTKTFTLAKRLVSTDVPLFTTDCEENRDLHQLGIPGLTRQNVGEFIEKLGANLSDPNKERQKRIDPLLPPAQDQSHALEPPMSQMSFWEN